tara:strand:- start:28264 stop:29313 length:1050 start_codon:yes stop_codon:yes gene_type:complete
MENQLAVLENLKPIPFFTKGDDVDDILEKIKKDALLHVPDLSTGKGRAEITANITRVTESKTYLEAQGKELAVEFKAIPAKIDANRKKVKEFLAELQVELRKPLTDWETEQAEIKAKKIADELAEKEAEEKDLLWDFAISENKLFDIDRNAETARLEAEAIAETARLKQVQIDNDARIAREAAEAATIDAERLAQKAIDDAQEAKQKAIDDKIVADNELLASQAREKLLNEQAAQEKINNEWLNYITEAYEINNKLNADAEQKRQNDLAEENRLASIETERLAGIERQRIAQKKIDDDEAVRMADANNIRLINRAIYKALTDAGVDPENAKIATQTLIDNKVPHTTINY